MAFLTRFSAVDPALQPAWIVGDERARSDSRVAIRRARLSRGPSRVSSSLGASRVTERPSVTWLTNIPTPYRHHRFRALHEALDGRGLALRVLYMAETEPQRPWGYDPAEASYPHRVMPGFTRTLAGRPIHVNPAIFGEVRRSPEVLVVGGVSNPTSWMAMGLSSRRTLTLLGAESNAQSELITHGPGSWVKTWMVRKADGFFVPGDETLGYLAQHDETAHTRPVVRIPNIVDESQFAPRGSSRAEAARRRMRHAWGVSDHDMAVLLPARLEAFKGVDDAIGAFELAGGAIGRAVLVLAGGGAREADIRRRVEGMRVKVLGRVPDGEMSDHYAGADVVLMPSHRDPSPLAVVEALRCGLPLMLSDAVGNRTEALEPGCNGWLVPAREPVRLAEAIEAAGSNSPTELMTMGRRSARIHQERFSTPVVMTQAARQLSELATQAGSR